MKLNTRLTLRNDSQKHWMDSDLQLLKGEVALAQLSGDLSSMFQLCIGTGDKKYSDMMQSNIVIPFENITNAISAVNTLIDKRLIPANSDLEEALNGEKGE